MTLTGPGGVGKSRLMVEAARRLGAGFADGVGFVELAAVSAADLVAAAIAAGLGLSTSAGQLITDLESYLRPRRLLLALDNFEQVLGAAPLVAGLLATAGGLVVLATSRAVLRLSGEHEFAVPPLPVPPAGAAPDPEELRRYAAVDLFAERAHAAASGFELTVGNAAAVAEICRRLDGLPLAIELAAARVRLLPPRALLERLDERFSLLTGGARDLPERQQTLRNTLDWSFGLLPAGEQALFARLGVFPGSFSLPAVEAIGAGSLGESQALGPGQVMDTLGALVDSSLVRPQTRSGEPRFSLLETIRQYALERLREGSDWVQAHDRHAAYFLALAEPAAADLAGPGQLAWLDRLETEHDNLWAAISWLADHGPLEQAVHLSLVTWRFWWLRGHAAELARLGNDFMAGSGDLPPYQRALALTQAGSLFIANGDLALGQQLFKQSLPLYRQGSENLGVVLNAIVLAALGHLAGLRHDNAGAGKLLDESKALLQELHDDDLAGYERLQHRLAVVLVDDFLGQVRLSQGDNDAATQLFTEGLGVARRARDRISLLVSLYDLAFARQAQGDLAGAAGHLQGGWRWRPKPAMKRAPPTISRSWRLSPDSSTTRSVPYACSLPPARSWTPGAAAGYTPSCRASRTTMRSWPRCAPSWATRHSRRRRRGAGPPGANARWNSQLSKRDPPRPRSSAAGCTGLRAGYDQAAGQAARTSSQAPACRRLRSRGSLATSNYSLRKHLVVRGDRGDSRCGRCGTLSVCWASARLRPTDEPSRGPVTAAGYGILNRGRVREHTRTAQRAVFKFVNPDFVRLDLNSVVRPALDVDRHDHLLSAINEICRGRGELSPKLPRILGEPFLDALSTTEDPARVGHGLRHD